MVGVGLEHLLGGWLVYLRWDLCYVVGLGFNFGLGVVAILMLAEEISGKKVKWMVLEREGICSSTFSSCFAWCFYWMEVRVDIQSMSLVFFGQLDPGLCVNG